MALQKLHYVYGLDTSCFYTEEEKRLEDRIIRSRHLLSVLNEWETKGKITSSLFTKHKHKTRSKNKSLYKLNHESRKSVLKAVISNTKAELKQLLHDNLNIPREVRPECLTLKRQVSIFDSNLTRCCHLKEREINEEIIIIQVYFFDVAYNLIQNGFTMNGNRYRFFSASAGQIRTKKFVAVREDLLNENWNTLTAGLTVERINQLGGININKYLAYLALCNSATDLWQDFDIDRCIVVDDFENIIQGSADFIDDKTYSITRQEMEVPITQTDGCGMILPTLSNKNFMVRLPWVKGLLAVFDYVKFIRDNNGIPEITDIYGDKHDVIAENIQIIFTKSQFKAYKYFKNWQEYKDNFKKYGCTAGKCNVEEDYVPNAKINYQMLQTLYDLTDDELMALANRTENDIVELCSDPSTMLKIFGADNSKLHKSGFQKCLNAYPELLSDPYTKATLKDIKESLQQELWSGKLKLDCKYTFVIPDLYAFCEYLFLNIKNPCGLLDNYQVSCRLYDNGLELDCLRSPHLYLEHAIRQNVVTNKVTEWFKTDAIYVSCKDMISKILQFDSDGDKLLIVNNRTIVNAAKRVMTNITPLFYNMAKAGAVEINTNNIFDGLIAAYTGGNIGEISNAITKIWNSGEITEEKIKVVKWLCMENNFIID